MSDLSGLRTLRVEAHIPPAGAWHATVTLDASSLPPLGPTVLTIGDLQLVGSVVRTAFDDNDPGALVTATLRGGAGWQTPVTRAGAYGVPGFNTAGHGTPIGGGSIRLSTILQDIARGAGERYIPPAEMDLGKGYSWQAHSPQAPVHYEDVLSDLVARGYLPTWRVEPFTGLTRFDGWPDLGPADAAGRVTDRDLAHGRRSVGLDVSVAAFLPGCTVEGARIERTSIFEDSSSLRAEVYAKAGAPTARQSMRAVVESMFPWLANVVAVAGQYGKGLAIRSASGLVHLAGGPSDPAVVRVGDLADGGTFAAGISPVTLIYTGADGKIWNVTLQAGATPVTAVIAPVGDATPGKIVAKASEGSKKVTCA